MNQKYLLLLPFLLLLACKKKNSDEVVLPTDKTYFSIVQFASDQFQTYGEQPYTFQRVITLNGKTDSSFVTAPYMDWESILKPFFSSDISAPKFLGQYDVSLLEDNTMDTRTLVYEAKNTALFTRTLQIVTDMETRKIKSIYIETEKNGTLQKLFYAPIKLIQIQEYESPMIGKDKALKVEYYFL